MEEGFLRVRCERCHAEKLVAFSCKKRGPPVAVDRMALAPSGQVRYSLKVPYRDGTTHIVLEPLDLLARLAALTPVPRMHLTRYHGLFAPHSTHAPTLLETLTRSPFCSRSRQPCRGAFEQLKH